MRAALLAAAAAGLALASCQQAAFADEAAVAAPAAARVAKEAPGLKTAIFSGGCFWGVEGVFSHVKGVKSAVAGYHGGTQATAHYETVSGGDTGHAESVKVTYDPRIVRYDQLLRVFFSVVADPTQKNRQGPDVGSQYRSAIVPLSEEQRAVAAAYLAQLGKAGLWKRPIVTRIERGQAFYPAEGYHQNYLERHPRDSYIAHWDMPKLRALKALYPGLYTAKPAA
jgi:peptide-methionine (S)-S-oxide reductase